MLNNLNLKNNEDENKIEINVPIMRSITECVNMIRQYDKNSCISEYFIRDLCENNKIRYFKSRTKFYVDFTYLINYLNGKV